MIATPIHPKSSPPTRSPDATGEPEPLGDDPEHLDAPIRNAITTETR
jgi:hypothetical protein